MDPTLLHFLFPRKTACDESRVAAVSVLPHVAACSSHRPKLCGFSCAVLTRPCSFYRYNDFLDCSRRTHLDIILTISSQIAVVQRYRSLSSLSRQDYEGRRLRGRAAPPPSILQRGCRRGALDADLPLAGSKEAYSFLFFFSRSTSSDLSIPSFPI